jgi:heat shock protein HslJ
MIRFVSYLIACAGFAMAADSLDHTKWVLTESPIAIPAKTKYTIQFDQGRYSIGGCNRMNGSYTVDGNKLSTKGGMSTQMACSGDRGALDNALSQAVSKNAAFAIDGPTLTLTSADGARFVFRSEPLPSKAAVTKVIYVAPFTKDCTGIGPMKCLQIRESKDQPWKLHYSGIVGFEHVPGIEYRLRIKEDKVAKPAADQSSVVWYLDMIVEQKVVDRAAADAALKK